MRSLRCVQAWLGLYHSNSCLVRQLIPFCFMQASSRAQHVTALLRARGARQQHPIVILFKACQQRRKSCGLPASNTHSAGPWNPACGQVCSGDELGCCYHLVASRGETFGRGAAQQRSHLCHFIAFVQA